MKTQISKNLYFNEETIVAFQIYGGGGNNRKVRCLGEAKIGDFISEYDLCYPTDEDGNDIEGEFTDCNGNGVGLTTEEVRTGIGCINYDGEYDTVVTVRLGEIEYTSKEAYAMVNDSDHFTAEQAVLYFINGESIENAEQIINEIGADVEDFFEDDEEEA